MLVTVFDAPFLNRFSSKNIYYILHKIFKIKKITLLNRKGQRRAMMHKKFIHMTESTNKNMWPWDLTFDKRVQNFSQKYQFMFCQRGHIHGEGWGKRRRTIGLTELQKQPPKCLSIILKRYEHRKEEMGRKALPVESGRRWTERVFQPHLFFHSELDLLGGVPAYPVAKTLSSRCRGPRMDPWSGN